MKLGKIIRNFTNCRNMYNVFVTLIVSATSILRLQDVVSTTSIVSATFVSRVQDVVYIASIASATSVSEVILRLLKVKA